MTKSQWIAIMFLIPLAIMGCQTRKDFVKNIPSEKQAILHLTSGNRLITLQDAEAIQAALKNYFSNMSLEQLKNQWSGYNIAQSPHGIGPVRFSQEGMCWIGRWVLQPSGDDLHLAYNVTPPSPDHSWVEYFIVVRQEAGKWEIIGGPGTEKFGPAH